MGDASSKPPNAINVAVVDCWENARPNPATQIAAIMTCHLRSIRSANIAMNNGVIGKSVAIKKLYCRLLTKLAPRDSIKAGTQLLNPKKTLACKKLWHGALN